AGVCPVSEWPDDAVMLRIAAENNLSETAFICGGGGKYHIRWFTPVSEFDLCGHATLGSAFVILNFLEPQRQAVDFTSMSGPLRVVREGDRYTLDFPARPPRPIPDMDLVTQALGAKPQ